MTSTPRAPRPGEQLASTVCDTRVIVVRAPAGAAPRIACGGEPMVPAATAAKPAGPAGGGAAGTLIGKRYVDEAGTLELLCTSSGSGALTCDGAPMTIKTAKPLPASD
ncbi:hypothetical protein [Actinomadura sp. 7K507]|uniref:hypothetical protein n=1 Tax=Actinomadura sp. 7K507 TaxID=2530365 RepID=UPI00104E368F|nr:hypothetical protein [Actinomadura sp. 7K507]TDC97967.1 hypothetical protein E1285_01900 [Actinomadura sp. 7K507]